MLQYNNGSTMKDKKCLITPAFLTPKQVIAARGPYIKETTLYSAGLLNGKAAVGHLTHRNQGLRPFLATLLEKPLRPRLVWFRVREQ